MIDTNTNETITTENNELKFLNTEEVAAVLGCSLPTASKIMRRPDFPLIRVGKNMRVSKSAFMKWAETRRI